jgi:hypothetical protein
LKYWDANEIMGSPEAAKLLSTSTDKLRQWRTTGKTPMGELKEGYHFYYEGTEPRFIKDRMCELFGILPKFRESA